MNESTGITSSSEKPTFSSKKRCKWASGVLVSLILAAIYGTFKPSPESVSPSLSSLNVQTPKHDPPQVAWLLSFPNSGTSYTMVNTMKVSQKQIASNYGNEMNPNPIALYHDSKKKRVPPYINGSSTLPLPNKYILTKTHCGGFCTYCHPHQFVVLSADNMERSCASESKGKRPYNVTRVGRAIHLFRNPLDNIVSRMHHDDKKNSSLVGTSSSQRDRLVYWCKGSAEVARKELKRTKLMPMNVSRYIRRQPLCGVEFFRYVQWHNRVWEMTEKRQLPVLTIFYEDYFTMYNNTVNSILEFLELSWKDEPHPLESNKTYRYLFTQEEIQATGEFMRARALPPVWKLLQRYFPGIKSAN